MVTVDRLCDTSVVVDKVIEHSAGALLRRHSGRDALRRIAGRWFLGVYRTSLTTDLCEPVCSTYHLISSTPG